MPKSPKLWTVADIMAEYGYSARTIRTLIHDGVLTPIDNRRPYAFRPAAVKRGIAKREKGRDPRLKVKAEDVPIIKSLADEGQLTYAEIGARFHISGQHVGRIVNGRRWQAS